ncbi:MAG: hypothetical protein ABI855_07285 [Bacteroidota bacterium]
MQFTIQNFIWKKEGLFGEDNINFKFDVINDEPKPYRYPEVIGLDIVLKYLPETDEKLADYIEEVRSSIDGWGPKESKLMDELEGSVDFEPFVFDLFHRKGWFTSEYDRWKKLRVMTPSEHKKIEKIAAELELDEKVLHQSTKNYYDFCESAEKALQGIAIRVYPEILDMDREKVKAFKYLFSREIQKMEEELVKFMSE